MGRLLFLLCLLLYSSGVARADPLAPQPKGPLRFIAVGDTGTGRNGQLAVGKAMAQKCKKDGCHLVLLLGDNLYDSGASTPNDPQFVTKFEQPYADVDAPFYVALGNHDYGGRGMGNEFDKPDNEIAYSLFSKKWRLPARSYHFESGPAEFFAVDTNGVLWGANTDGPAKVGTWLLNAKRPWKIAFGHHPYRSNGPHGNAGMYDQAFGEKLTSGVAVKSYLEKGVCGKADLYLAGHDHDKQWLTETCDGTELAVSGAGSSVTQLIGTNPTRYQSETLGFLYVVVDDTTLVAEFIGLDGRVEFTRTLKKKK